MIKETIKETYTDEVVVLPKGSYTFDKPIKLANAKLISLGETTLTYIGSEPNAELITLSNSSFLGITLVSKRNDSIGFRVRGDCELKSCIIDSSIQEGLISDNTNVTIRVEDCDFKYRKRRALFIAFALKVEIVSSLFGGSDVEDPVRIENTQECSIKRSYFDCTQNGVLKQDSKSTGLRCHGGNYSIDGCLINGNLFVGAGPWQRQEKTNLAIQNTTVYAGIRISDDTVIDAKSSVFVERYGRSSIFPSLSSASALYSGIFDRCRFIGKFDTKTLGKLDLSKSKVEPLTDTYIRFTYYLNGDPYMQQKYGEKAMNDSKNTLIIKHGLNVTNYFTIGKVSSKEPLVKVYAKKENQETIVNYPSGTGSMVMIIFKEDGSKVSDFYFTVFEAGEQRVINLEPTIVIPQPVPVPVPVPQPVPIPKETDSKNTLVIKHGLNVTNYFTVGKTSSEKPLVKVHAKKESQETVISYPSGTGGMVMINFKEDGSKVSDFYFTVFQAGEQRVLNLEPSNVTPPPPIPQPQPQPIPIPIPIPQPQPIPVWIPPQPVPVPQPVPNKALLTIADYIALSRTRSGNPRERLSRDSPNFWLKDLDISYVPRGQPGVRVGTMTNVTATHVGYSGPLVYPDGTASILRMEDKGADRQFQFLDTSFKTFANLLDLSNKSVLGYELVVVSSNLGMVWSVWACRSYALKGSGNRIVFQIEKPWKLEQDHWQRLSVNGLVTPADPVTDSGSGVWTMQDGKLFLIGLARGVTMNTNVASQITWMNVACNGVQGLGGIV